MTAGYQVQWFQDGRGWVFHQTACTREHAEQVASEIGGKNRPARVVNERGAVLYHSQEDDPAEGIEMTLRGITP